MISEFDNEFILRAPFLNREGLARDIGNLLLLAPHPDDESLGCGGLIALLSKTGANVHIIFITDGSASHPDSTNYSPLKLSRIRQAEAIRACRRLGVKYKELTFLNQPDSRMESFDDSALETLARLVAEKFKNGKYNTIAMPWRRDPHGDHIIVHEIGDLALRKIEDNVTKLEYPIWLWKKGSNGDWPKENEITPYRLNIKEVVSKKLMAIQEHASQLGRVIDDDPDGFVLTEELLEPFLGNTEYFFLTNLRPLDTLGKGYFDRLYSEKSDPWNFKGSSYEHEKYGHTIAALDQRKFNHGLELGCSVGIQTKLLSENCTNLVAVDISEVAIVAAKEECHELQNITFRCQDISTDFPKSKFDLITLCEVGYYFKRAVLLQIFNKIVNRLLPKGKLLMVHWTPFVPDYPLTGSEVHNLFEEYIENTNSSLVEVAKDVRELYRIQIWEKLKDGLSK